MDPRVRWVLGDVRDQDRLTEACRGVDVVVHSAALKRVEVCADNPLEAIQTNILGTANVARACVASGVPRACFLSTDKVASPATLYGASKLVAERLWCGWNVYSAGTQTRFSATRYGNVANSTGSVIPLWRKQAASGEVTITDPRMTRFLMSMDDAVSLVALALDQMRGGEVFLPKLQGARMSELARAIAPGATQRITGIRQDEKLHEQLVDPEEVRRTWDCGSHYVIEPPERTWGTVEAPRGSLVDPYFTYSSDAKPYMSANELARMVGA